MLHWSVRARIRGALAVLVLSTALQGALFIYGTLSSADLLGRAGRSHQQLQLLEGLKGEVGRLVAVQLQAVALNQAASTSTEILRGIEAQAAQLFALTADEIKLARNAEEATTEQAERARFERLRHRLDEVVATSRAAATLAAEGETSLALVRISALLDEVNGGIARLLDEGIEDERGELVAIDAEIHRRERFLLALALVGGAVSLVMVALLHTVVARALLKPVGRLVQGIRRIGNGSLTHRIPTDRHDELGLLAAHVNLMARRLDAKRRQLLKANQTLESEVALKTASLLQRNEELAEIDTRRRQFFADVSHELRTPLTTILGEAELALKFGRLEEDARQGVEAILANGSYLRRRIDDLLALARAGDGRLTLRRGRADLAEAVRQTVDGVGGLARINGIPLTCVIPDHPVVVSGDPGWLRQCLLTVLDNAIKFSAPGQAVEVALECREADAAILVHDMGAGIAEAELPRVFDRFYQTESGQRAGGTGLGLAVARWVVEEHGGRIRALSEMGKGTTIEMKLPLLMEDAGEPAAG